MQCHENKMMLLQINHFDSPIAVLFSIWIIILLKTICIEFTNWKNCYIEIVNHKARHNLMDRSDQLDGAGSFWEPLGQTQVMQIP